MPMQRTTSFFWASDDLHNFEVEEEQVYHYADDHDDHDDDDDETDGTDEAAGEAAAGAGGGGIHHWSIEEEDDEAAFAARRNSSGGRDDEDHHHVSSHERIALNRVALNNNGHGYGSSSASISTFAAPPPPPHDDNHGPISMRPPPILPNNGGMVASAAIDPITGRRRLFELPRHYSPTNNNILTKASSNHHGIANNANYKSIRFQVVIWHIGTIDVQTGHVKMRFRLTLFWNDDKKDSTTTTTNTGGGQQSSPNKTNHHSNSNDNNSDDDVWMMEGRQRACRRTWNINNNQPESSTIKEMIDVPPVSILNAVEFETVDDGPEITMTNSQTRSLRWTCMYNATLFQGDHMSVKDFPHDRHEIKLKVGILAHRGAGGRWDRNAYRLALAGEHDSQGSTRVPHGLVVDHCHVPDFGFDPGDLRFRFVPLMFGGCKESSSSREDKRDVYLQVTLPVHRMSGHYDTSILPMLVMLNVIAITSLTRNFASATAATEIMLSIAFVQVGIRLTLDSRLPSVGYQIKMQNVMNCCFWLLSGLVLESNTVFFLVRKRGWEIHTTDKIDLGAACVALVYNIYIIVTYFRGRGSGPIA